jgi:hypothetical protein
MPLFKIWMHVLLRSGKPVCDDDRRMFVATIST